MSTTTGERRFGLLLGSGALAAHEIAPIARQAEALGFAELWASEDYFFSGGFSTAAIALASTERLAVGIGVIPVYTRHPALAAMEAATLSGAFPGRFSLGVGTGVERWMRQIGIEPGRPLASVREYVEVLRRLAAGQSSTTEGLFPTSDVCLHAAHRFPVHLGAIGPRMLDLAAEISDGVILSVLSSAAYVRWAVERFSRQTTEQVPVVAFTMFACDEDGAAARERARGLLGRYLTRVSPMTDALGISTEVAERVERQAAGDEPGPVPDDWVRAMTVSGTPADCRAALDDLFAAGVSTVTLYLSPDRGISGQIAAAAELLG